MIAIPIKEANTGTFKLNEDMNAWLCTHPDAYIEKACCNGRDAEGNVDCACHGQDSVVCPNNNCTGIEDSEVDELFKKLA